MKLSFEGDTLRDIVARMGDFLNEYTTRDAPVGEPASEPKAKRTRWTAAQIAANKAGKDDAGREERAAQPTPAPTTRRRRGSMSETAEEDRAKEKPDPTTRRRSRRLSSTSGDTSMATEEKPEPTTRRRRRASAPSADAATTGARGRKRGTATSPSKDVADEDLVKAASALAQATNPQVVKDLLGEFGVAQVQELDGDARREFLTSAAQQVEDA